MSIVKLSNKDELDKLVATVILKIGRKLTQKEILDTSIKFSMENIDELIQYFEEDKKLSRKKAEEILKHSTDIEFSTNGSIDKDLYGTE